MLAESAAGELIASEVEIRSGPRGDLRRGGRRRRRSGAAGCSRWSTGWAWRWARRAPTPGPTTSTSGSSTRPTTTGCARNSAGSPSATTPGACTSTWACAAPTGRSPSATGCGSCCRCCSPPPPTRPSSTAATPACTRCAPRSSPAPSPAAACPRRSRDWDTYDDFVAHAGADRDRGRVDPALVERAPAPQLRHGRGADLRRPDARRGVDGAGRR